jgi:parallel beta-helix repeat protein
MASIAGLQDYRQQGPPADIGTYQFPATAMVFKFTFSGATYTVAIATGIGGWTLIAQSPSGADNVEINAAIAYLVGLGGGELYCATGTYSIAAAITDNGGDRITIEGTGDNTIFTIPNATNINVFEISGQDYWTFRKFAIDGNRAGQVDQGSGDNQNGIFLNDAHNCRFESLTIHSVMRNGIRAATTASNCGHVVDCHFHSYGNAATVYCGGVSLEATPKRWIIADSTFYQGGGVGVRCDGRAHVIVGNTFEDMQDLAGGSDGIFISGANYTVVASNNFLDCYDCITISAADLCAVVGNTIEEDSMMGIRIQDGSDNTIVSKNTIVKMTHTGYGIYINAANDNVIEGNSLQGYGSGGGTAVYLEGDADFNMLLDNKICANATGINISASTCNGTVVIGNRFGGKQGWMAVATPLSDSGTDTVLPTKTACFNKELGTAVWVTGAAAAMGIDIDAADEGALAKIKLPLDLQKVVRIKVWGIAQVAEADGMQLQVASTGAGGDNEAWNAEAIAVASKTSTTLNFAVGDVVQWTFTSSDDADIGDLAAGDFLQWCCVYAAASGANCATDLLLAGEGLEIQYV